MPESQLPQVYVKKEFKRSRADAGFFLDTRRPLKIRKEDNYYPPRSIFDRPTPALAKLRRDLKMQRYRGIFKPPPVPLPGLKQPPIPMKPLVEPEGMAEWFIYEDIAILNVIQQLQGLPLNLMLLSPGHTPNWDLVADIVNQTSRIYRTAKQCRYRYEAIVVPREEGKLIESPKKQKKNKNPLKATPPKGLRAMRTSQLFTNDNNNSFTKLMKVKYDNVKTAFLKKAPQLKQVLVNPSLKNPKHAAILGEFGISNYDAPMTPVDIAERRVEKLKEKQRITMATGQPQPSMIQVPDLVHSTPPPSQISSSQSSATSSSSQTQTIVVQTQQVQSQQQQQIQPNVPTVATLVQQSAVRSQPTINITQQHQQSPQIVKAIVSAASPHTSISGIVQHISLNQQSQQLQHHVQNIQQQHHQQTIVSQQTPVSVVLSSPISGVQQQQQQQQHQHQQNLQPQIVSIHQTVIPSSSAIITQSGSLVQTVQAQQATSGGVAQVVSVSQLGGVGTVFTTSCLPSNATVATLTTSSLRAQRIMPGMQEVVLQRPGTQSPAVVSVSGIGGQNVTQAQLQAAQLRLSMGSGGVTSVVTKGIPVGSAAGKPTNQTTQPLFFRPQMRQQLKVIHPGQPGQASLVGPTGTIIQGGIVQGQTVQLQQQGGQKVAVSSVVSGGSPSLVTNVATVQMGGGQTKTQFVKQINTKQAIATRQATEGEMLLVKRIGHHQQKSQQLIPQAQIFTPANLQVQQAGSSGQQQIATLVKTSSVGGTAGTVGMTLSQLKPGTLKATTIQSQGQMRQIQLQQQQVAMVQQRKGIPGKMTQITQVSGKATTAGGLGGGGAVVSGSVSHGGVGGGGMPTQLIVQTQKNMQNTVTVQQITHAFRPNSQQPGANNQIVLGKAGVGVGRVIPVSVSTQPNTRQIQVSHVKHFALV